MISILYYITFLSLYYISQTDIIGNLDALKQLSYKRVFLSHDIYKIINNLWNKYSAYPVSKSFYVCISIIGITAFVFMTIKKFNSFATLNFVFFIIGVSIWIKYFSYDGRNSIWTRSFFIIFVAISINFVYKIYIKDHLFQISINLPRFRVTCLVYSLFVFSLVAYIASLKDSYAYYRQQQSQEHIGSKNIAKIMVQLLANKEDCVQIYTGRQLTVFNYYVRSIRNKIKWGEWSARIILGNIKHTCKGGRYFIFGPWDKYNINTGWDEVIKLEQQKLIFPVGDKSNMIYFVPANIKLNGIYDK